MNAHLKGIQEGLIAYLPPIKKYKIINAQCATICRRPALLPSRDSWQDSLIWKITYKCSPGQTTAIRRMNMSSTILSFTPPPSGGKKQYYLQGWNFDSNPYKKTCNTSEIMEIVEQVYEEVKNYKKINRSDSNRAGNIRNKKRGESALPSKPEKGHSGKSKKTNSGNRNYQTTGENIHDTWPRTILWGVWSTDILLGKIRHPEAP